ncbi:hypothetical protein P153DRAFT_79539 [Dothidotthia symphoricarpi CBS 119687]|uniref:Uncharacterized protein n=1 Tax=Dothidotthia symphoricarpi CBS 119687 TaxID=1392245 RepID=A0A6A6A6I7_9PLEO|nr:uncharacterized protein P153DRAFT_79539 [Dothidotthia symphoricarpi CBS 119687]KAF2126537.1 hypothetical protein P153DRAFT_79539 [Dothidotthia symphoricarpi CBS 119687]
MSIFSGSPHRNLPNPIHWRHLSGGVTFCQAPQTLPTWSYQRPDNEPCSILPAPTGQVSTSYSIDSAPTSDTALATHIVPGVTVQTRPRAVSAKPPHLPFSTSRYTTLSSAKLDCARCAALQTLIAKRGWCGTSSLDTRLHHSRIVLHGTTECEVVNDL